MVLRPRFDSSKQNRLNIAILLCKCFNLQVRQLLNDFAVLISIIVMVGIDMAIGIETPKLEVPTEFKVRIMAVSALQKLYT